MIKRESNAYKQIKGNIAKLTIIQQATEFSPQKLVHLHLVYCTDLLEIMDVGKLSTKSFYKYFIKESCKYLKENQASKAYQTIFESVKEHYLTKKYFGSDYYEIIKEYKEAESTLRDFVLDGYKALFPITPEMTKAEVARRNQRMGKISVRNWIGDIGNYQFFHQAPNFMQVNVNNEIQMAEIFLHNLMDDKSLDLEIMKLSSNLYLEEKLAPKSIQIKTKLVKI
ncbi:hypothetical protein B9Z45_02100 [Limnohabitans sp. 2KL-17]|uniref:hypothetical protein n=1 Tax=Limnohabitans sp. 2KL-17 TaxID=1100704 RepID=UPI000D3D4CEE|nr:hypothetical protein [Limnohabitans sp. 2KL-17]PUE62879.1 hypothetical protein B9Z45_02100 [Limnohabitans sp. 2KL-17]